MGDFQGEYAFEPHYAEKEGGGGNTWGGHNRVQFGGVSPRLRVLKKIVSRNFFRSTPLMQEYFPFYAPHCCIHIRDRRKEVGVIAFLLPSSLYSNNPLTELLYTPKNYSLRCITNLPPISQIKGTFQDMFRKHTKSKFSALCD